jgi:hypothetical protein
MAHLKTPQNRVNAALAARRDAQDDTNPHFITFASFRPSLRTITGFL